jgi:tetratricopeptide (TPR) repeat protein
MKVLSLILASLFVFVGPTAVGDAIAQSKKDKAKAKKLYEEGLVYHQEKKDYERAAEKYKAAYALVPAPILLFNLAQVYRLNGDRRLAIQYYQRYLEEDPSGKGAGKAKKQLKALTAQLKKEEADAKRQAAEEERRRKEREAADAKRDKEPETDPDEVPDEEEEIDVAPSNNSGRAMRWAGVGTAVAGAISVGIGVKFGLDAKRLSDELSENTGPWTPELLAKVSEGESANTKMIVFTALGSAAIVGGGVMFFLGYKSGKAAQDDEDLAFMPTVTGDTVGVLMNGRF